MVLYARIQHCITNRGKTMEPKSHCQLHLVPHNLPLGWLLYGVSMYQENIHCVITGIHCTVSLIMMSWQMSWWFILPYLVRQKFTGRFTESLFHIAHKTWFGSTIIGSHEISKFSPNIIIIHTPSLCRKGAWLGSISLMTIQRLNTTTHNKCKVDTSLKKETSL